MANGRNDIRVATTWPTHPKTLALASDVGPSAPFHLIALWCFAGENRPEGVLRSPEEVEYGAGWRGKRGRLHASLVRCGWLEADGVTLHDWGVEQPWVRNREARLAAARENGRLGGLAKAKRAASNPVSGSLSTPATEPPTSPPLSPTPHHSAPATAEVLASPPDGQKRNGFHPKPPALWGHGPVPPDSGGALLAQRDRERAERVASLAARVAAGEALGPFDERFWRTFGPDRAKLAP